MSFLKGKCQWDSSFVRGLEKLCLGYPGSKFFTD